PRRKRNLVVVAVVNAQLAIAQIADENIFEPHIAAPARVELQRDGSIKGLRTWIGEVDHLDAVQPRHVAIAFHLEQILIPLAQANNSLVLRRGPYNPLTPVAIDTRRVPPNRAVDLELQP